MIYFKRVFGKKLKNLLQWIITLLLIQDTLGTFLNEIPYWNCLLKKNYVCPDPSIKFYLYTPGSPFRKTIDVRNPHSLRLAGWDPGKKTVMIVHGFNGTESKTPMTFIRDAYLSRVYNVVTVDWEPLTRFPCYLSALSNTRLVGQCTAQMHAHLINSGASARKTTCIGHSLGAHICGMMSQHLTTRPYKIIGLDPAAPLVNRFGNRAFRLTRDDANIVQIIHTNAGFLGQDAPIGHLDFCVNGGRIQPGCKGHPLRRARCSHFLSACYLAESVRLGKSFKGVPCPQGCPISNKGHWQSALLPPPQMSPPLPSGFTPKSISIGDDTPEHLRGTYCIKVDFTKSCPFD